MTTLATLRGKLNGDIGVAADGDTVPWTTAQRNDAISDAYAELWRVGVWKDAKQDIATVDDTWTYALTSIRKGYRLELLDSNSEIVSMPRGIVEPDFAGTGAYRVRLVRPIAGGYTLRVLGWTPFKSSFSGDSDNDDLPAEHIRIPLTKAKAILWRKELAKFAIVGQRQTTVPSMNVSIDALIALIATAEREFEDYAQKLAGQRPRTGLTGRL